ncbi:hypothetical protein DGMP_12720 [Desulfomarina profundi]|uniref:Diguanylate cyclase n=1 Tax=Desulfomarina profundi TaxID=2772557 RepID=A0A8D5FRV5_9BACT|nr:hypothetical protein DGMP_12720 [Desulfomarina profundi]
MLIGSQRRFNTSLQHLLEASGFACKSAEGREEIISLLATQNFPLIILDLDVMENGHSQIVEKIKRLNRKGKLIFLSRDCTLEKVLWGLRQGVDDFFKTPYSPDQLLASVEKILRQTGRTKPVVQQSRADLLKSEILHRYMVNNSPDIIYLLDQQGKIAFINRQAQALLGLPANDFIGRHYSRLVYPEDMEKVRFALSERRTGKRASRDIELRLVRWGNDKHPVVEVELFSTGVYKGGSQFPQNVFLGTYGVLRDVSRRKKLEKQFYHQLYHDSLTNLPNRSLFQDRLRLAISQARRNHEKLAVMFLDIDGFKDINDTFGHRYGDQLLQSFSSRLRSCLREGDTLARIAGDEFTILLPGIQGHKDSGKVAAKILAEFNVPFRLTDQEVKIGVSIGIALFPEHGNLEEELLQRADWAMYFVKHNGKNNFHYYEKTARTRNRVFSARQANP